MQEIDAQARTGMMEAESTGGPVGQAVACPLDRRVRLHGAVPRVLDPCSGSRMMWFDKQDADALFGDVRSETHTLCDGRTLRIEPDMLMDFRALPFPDGTFKLVAFDPPHLKHAGPKSWLRAKYGVLGDDWREDIRQGFAECFRVLASDGVLVFKWAEDQVKLREVLALAPVPPLFGHPTGRKGLTHWMVFMKPNVLVTGAGTASG